MHEANNSLGYEAGGDVLIRTVGQAIPRLLTDHERTARLHRAGDEFACLLQPEADGGGARGQTRTRKRRPPRPIPAGYSVKDASEPLAQ